MAFLQQQQLLRGNKRCVETSAAWKQALRISVRCEDVRCCSRKQLSDMARCVNTLQERCSTSAEELACMLPGAACGKLTRSTTLCRPTLSQLRRWRRGRLGNAAETARRERKCAGVHVGSDCCWLCVRAGACLLQANLGSCRRRTMR